MERQSRTILVVGATGQQGGAVARHLRDTGFHVRALTRDASSEKAQLLAAHGDEVVTGPYNNVRGMADGDAVKVEGAAAKKAS